MAKTGEDVSVKTPAGNTAPELEEEPKTLDADSGATHGGGGAETPKAGAEQEGGEPGHPLQYFPSRSPEAKEEATGLMEIGKTGTTNAGTDPELKKPPRKSSGTGSTTKRTKSKHDKPERFFNSMPLLVKTYFLEPTQDQWESLPAGEIVLLREPLDGAFTMGGGKKGKKPGGKKGGKKDATTADEEGQEEAAAAAGDKKKTPDWKKISEHLLELTAVEALKKKKLDEAA